MMLPSNHALTSQDRSISVLCVTNGLHRSIVWQDTAEDTLKTSGIRVLSVRNVFIVRHIWGHIWTFTVLNTSALNVESVFKTTKNWWNTNWVIRERNRLSVVFAADDSQRLVTSLCTAEFIVERNCTNVTCVTRHFVSLMIYRLTWEFTRARNHTSVHCATRVSASPATCSDINVLCTVTEDHVSVLTVECSLRQVMRWRLMLNWSVMFVFTLVQSCTHVDTAQIVLYGIVNSRHICWSHTMKVLGSPVTFVRRNSAADVTLRIMCFNMKMCSGRMFAAIVQRVSVQQLVWNTTVWCILTTNSFAAVCVTSVSNIKSALWDIIRDVSWNLDIGYSHPFLCN